MISLVTMFITLLCPMTQLVLIPIAVQLKLLCTKYLWCNAQATMRCCGEVPASPFCCWEAYVVLGSEGGLSSQVCVGSGSFLYVSIVCASGSRSFSLLAPRVESLGQLSAPQMGETTLALILSRAGGLPQPPMSSGSCPVQPQHPAARSSQRAASGGDEILPAIRHQAMIPHDLASWNRAKKEQSSGSTRW